MSEYGGAAADERVVEAMKSVKVSNNFKRRLARSKMREVKVFDAHTCWSVVPADFYSCRGVA